jgi:glycosyltransferase involved in cell wall biosynthesis
VKAKKSVESRLRVILVEFNIDPAKYEDGMHAFLTDSEFSCAFRSAIFFLATKASYPRHSEILEISEMLGRGDLRKALKFVGKKTTRGDYSRLVLPIDSLLVDVTRYARNFEMSGIPRVINALLTSKALENKSVGVWSNQVFGPVDCIDGSIRFPKHIWKSQRNIFHAYSVLRRVMKNESTKFLLGRVIAKILRQVREAIPYYLFVKFLNIKSPRACWIIGPKSLLIPEVPDAHNSDLLSAWIKATGIEDVRVIVHDLLPISHPHFFPSHAYDEHLSYLELLKVSQKLIVGTPVLADELSKAISKSENQPAICIVPLPISHNLLSAPAATRKVSQFIFVGGFQPRKGLADLVNFLGEFDVSVIDFKVVVVASAHFSDSKESLELLDKIRERPEIYEVKVDLSDSELFDLMHTSAAVLYLSKYEGYGLPILESLSIGTPVIAFPSPTNLHFSQLYGGIYFLSNEIDKSNLSELNKIGRFGRVHLELQNSINSSDLPTDKDIWSEQILSV